MPREHFSFPPTQSQNFFLKLLYLFAGPTWIIGDSKATMPSSHICFGSTGRPILHWARWQGYAGLGVPARLTTSSPIQASNIGPWRKSRCPAPFDCEQPAILVPVPRCGVISNIPPVLAAISSVSHARTASHGSMEGSRGEKGWRTDHCQKNQPTWHCRNVRCWQCQ